MRVIGHLENEQAARRFGDFLYVQGVVNTIERDDQAWAVWVHDDDLLKKAGDWLSAFRVNPADPQFDAGTKATAKREEERQDLKDFQKRFKGRQEVFRRLTSFGVGKLTVFLIAISVVVALLSTTLSGLTQFRLCDNDNAIMGLFITKWEIAGNYIQWEPGLLEIRNGEVWRLFTPMFLHFSILHLLFNMMCLRDLGSVVEGYEGPWRLLFIVLLCAGISNLAQYSISIPAFPTISGGAPRFGGMSGVIYGLFGYIWMRGKFDPRSGLVLHQSIVIQMLVWLVLCFTGILGSIANLAHLFGLLVGMALGFLFSLHRQAR
jgi:GlpG protein